MDTITIDYNNLITFYVGESKDRKGFAAVDFMLEGDHSVSYAVTLEGVMTVLSNFNRTEENLQGLTKISMKGQPTIEIRGSILVEALLEAKALLEK